MNVHAIARRMRRVLSIVASASPSELSLTRPTWTDDGAGGRRRGEPMAVSPVMVYVFRPKPGGDVAAVTGAGGAVKSQVLALAAPDADLAIDDEFEWQDGRYRVGKVRKKSFGGEVLAIEAVCGELS